MLIDRNPHLLLEEELNPPGITVWVGIWGWGLVGLYFLWDSNHWKVPLNVKRHCVDRVQQWLNLCLFSVEKKMSLPHCDLKVRELLNDTFE